MSIASSWGFVIVTKDDTTGGSGTSARVAGGRFKPILIVEFFFTQDASFDILRVERRNKVVVILDGSQSLENRGFPGGRRRFC